MMNIKPLIIKDVIEIYQTYMEEDFPDNERRPLSSIISLINDGKYTAYGLYQDHTLCGYAMIYGYQNMFLLDYFAIIQKYRQHRLGSQFLSLLLEKHKNQTIFLEAEDPDLDPNETKTRRIHFYLRAGLHIQTVRLYLFSVHYVILANHPMDQKTLESFYRTLYPDEFYEQFIQFKPHA